MDEENDIDLAEEDGVLVEEIEEVTLIAIEEHKHEVFSLSIILEGTDQQIRARWENESEEML